MGLLSDRRNWTHPRGYCRPAVCRSNLSACACAALLHIVLQRLLNSPPHQFVPRYYSAKEAFKGWSLTPPSSHSPWPRAPASPVPPAPAPPPPRLSPTPPDNFPSAPQ